MCSRQRQSFKPGMQRTRLELMLFHCLLYLGGKRHGNDSVDGAALAESAMNIYDRKFSSGNQDEVGRISISVC